MIYIGIDLGTSSVKLLAMDETGRVLHSVSRKYPISFPNPGWSEQNPEDWYRETIAGLKELTAGLDRSLVRGISFGGQMHGLVILDEADRVIRPAILWNDGRSSTETVYLNEVVGKKFLSEHTANIAFAGFTAPKILWVKEHEPENFAKIRKIMLPKDYLAYRLSGSFCTDYSDASGMLLLDVKNRRWSEDMIALCSITREQLPDLYESYEPVGTLLPSAAEELGFPQNVVVAAGAGDNAAAAVGTGTVCGSSTASCNISLGTSGTVFITSDDFRSDSHNALHAFAHADGRYHLMGCMLSAASCVSWWDNQILLTSDHNAEQAAIPESALGKNSVYFLPYLMGERSPHNNPDATGVFFGMRMDTTREAMSQAVLEGVAFGLRDSVETARDLGIAVDRAKLCGGGAKSRIWQTILASALHLELDIPEIEEGPSLGGAMLAAVACGEASSVKEIADRVVHIANTITPDAALAAAYDERYAFFRSLYPALKESFSRM